VKKTKFGSAGMFTVVVTAKAFAARGAAILSDAGCRILYAPTVQELEKLLASEPVDAVVSRTIDLTGSAIRSCPSLKVISKHGVGFNNIDVDTATALGIPVFFTPGANAQAVAELAIGLMVSIARGIPHHNKVLHGGGWSRATTGLQLSALTLGIVGLGQIGRRVARYAAAIGMKVIATDPNVRQTELPLIPLDDLLPAANVLTVHCPLNKETKGMIGARELALLPDHAIVINTARGGIIDEEALADAVLSGKLTGAALDSFVEEPLGPNHRFRDIPEIILTPHTGASTQEALDTVAIMAANNALSILTGTPPVKRSYCINPIVLETENKVVSS
jgi:D-3-phosphoglycerate dehydrogenase